MIEQYKLLKKLWETSSIEVSKRMLENAEKFLSQHHPVHADDLRPADPKGYTGMNEGCIFWDGAFEPFLLETPEAVNYREVIAENGNEEDESTLIGILWVQTLTKANAGRYHFMILTFLDILVRGL